MDVKKWCIVNEQDDTAAESTKLSWKVYREEPNSKQIIAYDLFEREHWNRVVRQLKAQCDSKEEFAEKLRTKLMSQYWCRSEYEIVLTSWPPYIETAEIDELKYEAMEHKHRWGNEPYRVIPPLIVSEKIDIFSQLELNWAQFIDYVWANTPKALSYWVMLDISGDLVFYYDEPKCISRLLYFDNEVAAKQFAAQLEISTGEPIQVSQISESELDAEQLQDLFNATDYEVYCNGDDIDMRKIGEK